MQMAIPVGKEEEARAFYRDVLGMTEVDKPVALADKGGLWLSCRGVSLHLGVEDPFVPARKAHPAFEVPDVFAARAVLEEFNPSEISELSGLCRFYVADPFGNRIEILETN